MSRRRKALTAPWSWGGVVTVLVPLSALALVLLGYGYTLAVQAVFGIDAALVADSLPDYLRSSAHVVVHFVAGVSEASQRWETYERLYVDMWPQLLIGVTAWVLFFVVWLPRAWWGLRFAELNAAGERVVSAYRRWEPPWLNPVRTKLAGALSFLATPLQWLARAPRTVWWAIGSLALFVGWPLVSLALAVLAVMLVGFVFSLLPWIGYEVGKSSLQQWVVEQVQQAKLKSSDFIKLEVSHTQTLGPEALEKWNSNAHAEGEGKLVWGDSQLGDVDFSAEAAAMRFYSGGGLSAELAPLKGNVSLKAEGSVEVAFAEGKVGGNLYLPSKEGVMLYYLDAEQLVDLASGKGVDTGRYDLGAIRLQCGAELKGVIGVSLAGEVSIGVEMKDIDTQDVDGKTKPGKMPRLNGSRKKVKRRKAVDVTGTDDDWKNTAGLAAEVNFFAGAKGGLGISGSVQWRNPHSKDKKFEPFASIAPELQAMAGLAGEAKLAIEYVDGIFRITAHAGLCVGVGAEGTFTFAVGAKQLASFVYWMYYNLLHAGFRSLVFIAESAFEALKRLGYLMVVEGKEAAAYFGRQLREVETSLVETARRYEAKFRKESETLALAQRVLSSLDRIRFTTPESKGMLIYQLTRFGAVSWALDWGGLGSAYLPTQRKAVLAVLRQATISNDLKNVIEHIHKEGERVSLDRNLNELRNFFAAEGPGGLNVPGTRTDYQDEFQKMVRKTIDPHFIAMGPAGQVDQLAMNGDFMAWYNAVLPSLMDEPVRGQVALASSDPGYALLRDGSQQDHPLFASSAGGYYSDMA